MHSNRAPRSGQQLLYKTCDQIPAVDKFVEAFFPPGAWWVGHIVEMRGEELLVSWHGATPSWINCKGEFSAPHDERRVRILGFQKPSEMGPFYMDMSMDTGMDIDI